MEEIIMIEAKDAIFVDLDIIEKLLDVIDFINYEKLKRVLIVLVQNILLDKQLERQFGKKNK